MERSHHSDKLIDTTQLATIRMDYPTNIFSSRSQYIIHYRQIYKVMAKHEEYYQQLLELGSLENTDVGPNESSFPLSDKSRDCD